MKNFKQLFFAQGGLAAVEFAFILPLLLIMSLPLYNVSQYILAVQKTNKVTATVADMVILSRPVEATTTLAEVNADPLFISRTTLQSIMNSTRNLMLPFGFPSAAPNRTCQNTVIRIFSVYKPSATQPARTVWTANYTGGTIPVQINNSPPPAPPASVPAAFYNNMFNEENAIIVEATCRYIPPVGIDPTLAPVFGATDISSVSVMPARDGALLRVFVN